jgi:hypothetical protein
MNDTIDKLMCFFLFAIGIFITTTLGWLLFIIVSSSKLRVNAIEEIEDNVYELVNQPSSLRK